MFTYIVGLYFLCVFNTYSIMAVRNTSPLLLRLRDLMKIKYVGEPIQGYIVLSEDAHQVNFCYNHCIFINIIYYPYLVELFY